VTKPGVEPTSSGCMTGDRATDLKRSALISGTGIHRLIYRDICVACIFKFIYIAGSPFGLRQKGSDELPICAPIYVSGQVYIHKFI